MSTDTPRTDANEWLCHDCGTMDRLGGQCDSVVVYADLARTLERELSTAQFQLDRIRGAISCHELSPEVVGELRRQIKLCAIPCRPDGEVPILARLNEAQSRATKAEAELERWKGLVNEFADWCRDELPYDNREQCERCQPLAKLTDLKEKNEN